METLKFKTNIKCGGCIAQVTPHLNAVEGIEHWEVNTQSPEKVLTVQTNLDKAQEVQEAVLKAGFKAEPYA